jgi:hypothetical protein
MRTFVETLGIKHFTGTFEVAIEYSPREDGRPAPTKVSIAIPKDRGSELARAARDGAALLTLALQRGIPLKEMQDDSTREGDGAPSSIIGVVIDRLIEGGNV